MVKLRVTVRVIPEDAYLAATETTSVQNTFIRGERRFYVIVREPETWYIGTLALEIKKRYESLYKHDLGEIKYLKDNTDDCDLDPELTVSDALVDEGKILSDPSDQHVVVRVIQEQGRAVRTGSVIPDLSQVHYQLPERPIRPPVPTFPGVEASVGKRKADAELLAIAIPGATFKRTRLDEIERDRPVASIEREHITHSNIEVHNSQERLVTPPVSQLENPISPQDPWSFSQIGPPTLIPSTSQEQQDQQHDTNNNSHVQPLNGTPSSSTRKLKSPKINGLQTKSPLAAVSSTSKKFLKPRKDVYAEPESDIDDSQMSPSSRDTSRITPRLVPSGRKKAAEGMDLTVTAEERATLSSLLGRAGAFRQPNGISHRSAELEEVTSRAGEAIGRDAISNAANEASELQLHATLSELKHNHAQIPAVPAAVSMDGDAEISDAGSKHSVSRKSRRRRQKRDSGQAEKVSAQSTTPLTTKVNKETPDGISNITTPEPDSPGEQLSQLLQESARKVTHGSGPRSNPMKLETTSSKRKSKDKSETKAKEPRTKKNEAKTATKGEVSNTNSMSEESTIKRTPEVASRAVGSKFKTVTLEVPTTARAAQEASHDSHATTSSKTIILPPGMTQEQYDKIVKGHSDLLAAGVDMSTKKKSTPSLRQNPSTEVPANEGESAAAKSKKATRFAVSKTPTPSAKRLEKSSISVTRPSAENSPAPKEAAKVKAGVDKESAVAASVAAPSKSKNKTKSKEGESEPDAIETPAKPSDTQSTKSDKSKSESTTAPSKISSTPSHSFKAGPKSSTKSTTAHAKQPTPTPSTASIATSTTSTTQPTKEPASSTSKPMPPPSASITKSTSTTGTPTPKPKSKTTATTIATTTSSSSTKAKQSTRPSLPVSLSSARSLKELNALRNANSSTTSATNSPAPTSRFAPPKKSILVASSSSSSDSDSSSASSSNSAPAPKKQSVPNTPKSQPDPTIRDRDESDCDSESGSESGG